MKDVTFLLNSTFIDILDYMELYKRENEDDGEKVAKIDNQVNINMATSTSDFINKLTELKKDFKVFIPSLKKEASAKQITLQDQKYIISDFLTITEEILLRFTVSDLMDSSLVEAAIDDIKF